MKSSLFIVVACAVAAFGAARGFAMAAPLPSGEADEFFARNWRVDDGLPHDVAYGIAPDGAGYLWVWGAGGLARFDGGNFEAVRVPTDSLDNGSVIRALVREADDTLVMLPPGGGVLTLRHDTFVPHPVSAQLRGGDPTDLFAEPNGALWVGMSDSRLVRWEPGGTLWFGPADGLERRTVGFSFAVDGTGRTWVASAGYLGAFSQGRLRRESSLPQDAVRLGQGLHGRVLIATADRLLVREAGTVRTLYAGSDWPAKRWGIQQVREDASGRIWIGSRRRGLLVLDQGHLAPAPGPKTMVTGLTEDYQGNLWAASNGEGIFRLRPKAFLLLDSSRGLEADASTAVCQDSTGTLWLANREGGVASYVQGRMRRFVPTVAADRFYANTVCCDRSDRIWIGAYNGLYRLPAGGQGPIERVTDERSDIHILYCDRDGAMWVGTGDGHLGFYRNDRWTPVTALNGAQIGHVNCLAEDAAGRLWAAADREIFEFDGHGLVRRLARGDTPGGTIHALRIDAEGDFWLGTDHGLVLWRRQLARRFSRTEGLPDEMVSQILEDGDGRLWLGGKLGYFHVAKADLRALAEGRVPRVQGILFGKADGLTGASSMARCEPSAWKARDGRLWFATYEGVIGIDPAKAPVQRPPPPVMISGVDGIRSLSSQVEIRFGVPSFTAPEKIQVRHQLAGYDVGWIATGSDRLARYPRLPPGQYVLQASARDEDGRWGRPTELAFAIPPAWWQTWWAQALAAAGALAAVAAGVRYVSHRALRRRVERLERAQALERERARIARDLHDELGAGLTRIGLAAERIRHSVAEEARDEALEQLAVDARRVAFDLAGIVWTVNPKNGSLRRMTAFIERLASSFLGEAEIHCRIVGRDDLPDLPIAPEWQHHVLAVAKEALNNIVRHSGASAAEVVMAFDRAEGGFTLTLRDNGRGFDPAVEPDGNGLANLRRRLSELGGAFVVESAPGRGTVVHAAAPLRTRGSVRPAAPLLLPTP